MSSEDKAVLKQLEQEQFNSMQRELSEFKNKLESMIIQEKEVQARKRSKNVSKMSDEGFEKEKAQLETKLNKQKAESLAEHRRRKELEHKQELRDIELKYLDLLETEERQGSFRAKLETHDESRIFYEEKLRSLQRELAHTQNQLFNKDENLRELREDKLKLEYEAKRALVEAEDLKGKGQTIQNVVLQDLNKQILERNKELERLKFNNPNRIEKLEKELEDLKEFLIGRRRSSADPSMRRKSGHSKSRDEIVQLKQKLVVKRKEAKDIQKTLEYDQMK